MIEQLTIYCDHARAHLPTAGGLVWQRGAGWGWIAHAGLLDDQRSRLGSAATRDDALRAARAAQLELVALVYGDDAPAPTGGWPCPKVAT